MNRASAIAEPSQAIGSKSRRANTRRVHLVGRLVMNVQKLMHRSRMRARNLKIAITRASSMVKMVDVALSGSCWVLSLCAGD